MLMCFVVGCRYKMCSHKQGLMCFQIRHAHAHSAAALKGRSTLQELKESHSLDGIWGKCAQACDMLYSDTCLYKLMV